jgi:prevent-host-death family protein
MKTVSVRDLQKRLREYVDAAQEDRIVITHRGKPAAVLVGVEGADWETVVVETNASFWRLIEKRRKQHTVSLADMRKKLQKPA